MTKIKTTTILVMLVCFLGCLPQTKAAPEPNTIVVPDDYYTIQQAVDAANEGNTVFVREGTYNGCVFVNKSLSLIGENKETTKIVGDWELNGTAVLVRHNNVTIKDFTIQSVNTNLGRGVHLLHVQHCLVSSCIFARNNIGVWLYGSSENIVKNNKMNTKSSTSYGSGIKLQESHNNSIQNNTMHNYEWGNGIYLHSSTKNYLSHNFASNCFGGIFCYKSDNNTLRSNRVTTGHNYFTDTPDNGVRGSFGLKIQVASNNLVESNSFLYTSNAVQILSSSQENRIQYNNITNSLYCGLALAQNASYNLILGNKITNNKPGLEIKGSTNNILKNNDISDNTYNIWIDGDKPEHYVQDFDASNTVDGKPVYYWVNKHNATVPSDAGHVSLVNCINVTISGVQISNTYHGVVLAYTTNSTITKTAIISNYYGIKLHQSPNNTIIENNIKHNYWAICVGTSTQNTITNNNLQENYKYGLFFFNASENTITTNSIQRNWIGAGFSNCSNNVVYHNNFIENIQQQVEIEKNTTGYTPVPDGMQIFDKGSHLGGNYWSDYNGTDTNNDGIGDTQYLISEYLNNTDNYPLIAPVEVNVIPEFPAKIIFPLLLVASVAVTVYKKKLVKKPNLA